MTFSNQVILINGFAFAGKDTLFKLLNGIDSNYRRYAFADALKEDLKDFIKDYYNIDIFNCTSEQKALIRPLLIAHGCAKREQDIDYWAKKVEDKIARDLLKDKSIIPCVCDFRFISEFFYLRKSFQNITIVKVERENPFSTPPEEERRNQPQIDPYVDHFIQWPTVNSEDIGQLKVYAEDLIEKLNVAKHD